MALYKATIEVLVEVDSWPEACDAIAEGIRPMLKAYHPEHETAWVDWRYLGASLPEPHSGEGFELAEEAQ